MFYCKMDNGMILPRFINRQIIEELIKGKLKTEKMANLSKGRLSQKENDISEALVREVREHSRFMIKASLKHIRAMEKIL